MRIMDQINVAGRLAGHAVGAHIRGRIHHPPILSITAGAAPVFVNGLQNPVGQCAGAQATGPDNADA